MFVILREILVLCLGVIVAVVAAIVCRLCGNKLELLSGIVVPICFCLGRVSLTSACPKNMCAVRQALYQILRAFALIMLLLFEMGMGLFIESKDIPVAVWAVIVGFGMVYVLSIYIAESMQKLWTEDFVFDGNDYIQSE